MNIPPYRKDQNMRQVRKFAKFASISQVCPSLVSLRQIWGVVLLPFLLTPLLVFQAAPARDQAIFATPTPYPAIVATQTAAQQAQAQASASLAQAAQMRASAAEMERNGQAQYAQAQADINAARAAQAAQNGAAVGEAIGRVEATINQLRDTVAGQAGIIATLTADREVQAQQRISDTVEIQSLRNQVNNLTVDKKTALANFDAVAQALDETKRQGQAVPIVTLVIGVLFASICAVLIVAVLQRKGQNGQATIINDHAESLDSAAPDEPIDAEVVT